MKVIYKDTEINVNMTNANVLEAIGDIDCKIKSMNCKSFSEMAAKIRDVGNSVKAVVEESGENFDKLFPKPDYMDYITFINALTETFNKADFSKENFLK